MADKCTDVTTVEQFSLVCRWIENSEPTQHFIDLLPMKRTDAESIYSALVERLKSKNIQLSNHIGMGFDGAATFSGKKSGVQAKMKEHSPHALFVNCHCHQLQEKKRQCFIHQLRDNISSHFTSSDVVSTFSIFDPRKVPATSSSLFSLYGKGAIDTLIDHYAQDFPTESVHGVQFVKEGIISLVVRTE